jgi:putative RNA 2'-phosphotransferase
MDRKHLTITSKFLSKVLRHEPEMIGLTLDSAGWVNVDELLAACRRGGHAIAREELDHIVSSNDKKRFAYSDDGTRIRASQGHSVEVALEYPPAQPPDTLYHGTFPAVLELIRTGGIKKMSRHHVHLAADMTTAERVGQRRGRPVILTVAAARLAGDGHTFFVSENHVWLTDHVPPAYITFPEGA